jgi:hypothetical protein
VVVKLKLSDDQNAGADEVARIKIKHNAVKYDDIKCVLNKLQMKQQLKAYNI